MNEKQLSRLKFLNLKFKEYMETMGWSERTIKSYLNELKFFIEYLKTTELEDANGITREIVQNYQSYLYSYQSRHLKTKGGAAGSLSLSTQLCKLVTIRSFFRFLVRRGYYMYDPASALELPRCRRNLPRAVMTKKEVSKLLNQPDADTAYGLRDKAILELFYSTGMRNSELRNLMVNDIDIGNLEARINEGKGRKDRVVPLGEIAGKYLELYIKEARPWFSNVREQLVFGRLRNPEKKLEAENGLLFFGGHGKKLQVGGIDMIVRKYVNKAKLSKPVTPHTLRHTCATHLLQGKAGLRYIQELLGHACVNTTQIYTHVEIGDLKREHHRCHPRERIQR